MSKFLYISRWQWSSRNSQQLGQLPLQFEHQYFCVSGEEGWGCYENCVNLKWARRWIYFFLFCFSKEEDHCLFLTSSLRNVFAKNRADKCPRQNGRPSFFHPLGKKEFFLCDFLFRTISFSILLLCTTLHPILSSPDYSFVCHLHPTSPQGRFLPSFLFYGPSYLDIGQPSRWKI